MNNWNILHNMEEIIKFQETCKLSTLNHKAIENLNRPVTSKEIESVNKTSPHLKFQYHKPS